MGIFIFIFHHDADQRKFPYLAKNQDNGAIQCEDRMVNWGLQ